MILPRKAVLELAKLLADSDEPVDDRALRQPGARSASATIELVTKIIDGKFPDYTRVIPTELQEAHLRSTASRCCRRCSAPRSSPTRNSAACAGCSTDEQPEDFLHQQRAGRGAGRARGRLRGRRARHRLQHHLPARRAEQRRAARASTARSATPTAACSSRCRTAAISATSSCRCASSE